MRYLLDVNALVALGLRNHEFHNRVARWLKAEQFPPVATCSITELGFVRVLAQASAYGLSVADARAVLLRLTKEPHIIIYILYGRPGPLPSARMGNYSQANN